MAHDGMRDVLLVDDDEVDLGARPAPAGRRRTADPASDDPPTAPGRSGRRRLALVTVVAALVGGAFVVDGVRARGDGADGRVADLAGALRPVGPGLREVWRQPAGWQRTPTAGGDVLVAGYDADRQDTLTLVDAATGEQRWVAPLPELTISGDLACVSYADAARERTTEVVCRVATAMEPRGFGRHTVAPDAESLLLVLDGRTGARVVERSLGRRFPTVATLDEDLLLSELDTDGHVAVSRQDPGTGRVRWTFRSPQPVIGAGLGAPPPQAQVRHGVIAVDGPAAWALTPDGAPLGGWHPQRPGHPEEGDRTVDLRVLPDGRFVVGEPDAGGLDGEPWGTVSTSDARDGVAVPGPLLAPVVDDGSARGVLLTVPPGHGEVVAVDPATGRWRWRTPSRGAAVVLDGRLLTRFGGSVMAVDTVSGERLWTAEVAPRWSGHGLLTDGHVALVHASGPDGEPELTALDVTDGRERWSVPVPPSVIGLMVVDGRVLAVTDRELVGFG